jgi:hypothetical protein
MNYSKRLNNNVSERNCSVIGEKLTPTILFRYGQHTWAPASNSLEIFRKYDLFSHYGLHIGTGRLSTDESHCVLLGRWNQNFMTSHETANRTESESSLCL